VYGENSLPWRSPSFTPTQPYLFIVDSNISPTLASLPFIVVELSLISKRPSELGRQARTATLNLHVFGRNRGERDDLASYLQDWLATSGSGNKVSVKDYGTAGWPEVDTALVTSGVGVVQVQPTEERMESASTDNWNIVSCVLQFKTK